ncbi:hypothetical protein ACPOL_6745 (plasmid) [Acidisarcina polymorpha]|uniref:Uncharacterized protein n=1 Tax=Acidisarcina polymorpha TaxID=2211140 RepID=A0A2Z5GBE3_9BACT|nr:hypothetical protein ACPOL_6745 [Acidisarcina polymorpha]
MRGGYPVEISSARLIRQEQPLFSTCENDLTSKRLQSLGSR